MHTETNTDDANVEEDKDLKADNGDADRTTRRERIKVIKSNLFNTLENIIVDHNSGASRSVFFKNKKSHTTCPNSNDIGIFENIHNSIKM